MTNSLMKWHLARDNQSKLHTFCEKHKTTSVTELSTSVRYCLIIGISKLVWRWESAHSDGQDS